jgi:hypothetical protein
MTLLTIGSIVLASIALASTFMISRKMKTGWLVSMIFNCAALPYDGITRQYGFIATGALAFVIAWVAFVRWGRDADSDPPCKG